MKAYSVACIFIGACSMLAVATGMLIMCAVIATTGKIIMLDGLMFGGLFGVLGSMIAFIAGHSVAWCFTGIGPFDALDKFK